MKYKSLAVSLVIWIALVGVFYPVMNKYSQSFEFVDEAEHLVMAWLMDKGYRLYTDFPNNHQPINYLISYTIQQVDPVDNVFMLVRRHRQFIFFWSAAWWWVLMHRFGQKMLAPIFLFEALKYFTLGNEFLSESIIVYPMAFLVGNLMMLDRRKPTKLEHYMTGMVTGFIQLTLLPMVIALMAVTLARYGYLKMKGLKYFLLGGLSVVILVFLVVNPVDYIVEIRNALVYSLSGLNPIKSPIDYLKLLGLPFLYFLIPKDVMAQVVMLMTGVSLGSLLVFKKKKHKKKLVLLGMTLVTWLLTNMRTVETDNYFYQGFHIMPWLLVGMTVAWLGFWEAVKLLKQRLRLVFVGVIVMGVGLILTHNNLPLYTEVNANEEHYIQYAPMEQAAELIRELKQPEDRLMVIPNDSFIYYMANIEPAPTNMFTFYDWQLDVPRNNRLFYDVLNNSPPSFMVYYDDGSSYSPFVNELLKSSYIQLMHMPNVYIHKEHSDRIEGYEWSDERILIN